MRAQLYSMMAVQARDSAVALATAVASFTDEEDTLYRSTLLKALTESGGYEEVAYISSTGEQIAHQNPLYIPEVPPWFQQLVPITPPAGRAEVRSGWDLAGHIVVVRSPAGGYRLLWRTAVGLTGTALMGLALALWRQRQWREHHGRLEQEVKTLRQRLLEKRAPLFHHSSPSPEKEALPVPVEWHKRPASQHSTELDD